MFVAAGGVPDGWLLFWTMVGGYLAAGGANAINHYVDRDIDGRMSRTTGRPVVAGRVPPARALAFGVALGALSALVLGVFANWLAAALALLGLALYVGVYTLWLKRTTVHNIVIGGSAGAVPPLVGWAAVTGDLGLMALAAVRDRLLLDAAALLGARADPRARLRGGGRAHAPRGAGEAETRRQILLWTLVMVAVTLLPVVSGAAGALYLASALALGAVFCGLAALLARDGGLRWARATFHYSPPLPRADLRRPRDRRRLACGDEARDRSGGRGPSFFLSPLGIVFTTVVIDLVGFGIVLPILPLWAERLRRLAHRDRAADRLVRGRPAAVRAPVGPPVRPLRPPAGDPGLPRRERGRRAADRARADAGAALGRAGPAGGRRRLLRGRPGVRRRRHHGPRPRARDGADRRGLRPGASSSGPPSARCSRPSTPACRSSWPRASRR